MHAFLSSTLNPLLGKYNNFLIWMNSTNMLNSCFLLNESKQMWCLKTRLWILESLFSDGFHLLPRAAVKFWSCSEVRDMILTNFYRLIFIQKNYPFEYFTIFFWYLKWALKMHSEQSPSIWEHLRSALKDPPE